jgi:hypothetical protein
MRGFRTLALLALLGVTVVSAETSTKEPRVRGCFLNTDEFCKKRCGPNEAFCFFECKKQCMTPGDGDSINLPPKK